MGVVSAHAGDRFYPKQKPRHSRRGPLNRREHFGSRPKQSGRNTLIQIVWLAQHIATAPDGLDEVAAFGGIGELLAQLADEDVDDLQFRFVHAAIEMIEELLLGQR